MEAPYKVTNNIELQRFEISTDGKTSYIAYQLFDGGISFISEKVPEAVQGQGIGSQLAKYVLDYALQQKLLINPQCAFVKWYVDMHPEYQKNSVLHNVL